jgi:hypothetical protein
LIAAVELLALEAANPPIVAGAAPRPRTIPGNGAVVALPTGSLAGCCRWLPIVFSLDPSFAAVAGLFSPGGGRSFAEVRWV